MKKEISIDDYEIGQQLNFDLYEFETKEYQYILFYPILKYCIDVLNNTKDLDKIKLNIVF